LVTFPIHIHSPLTHAHFRHSQHFKLMHKYTSNRPSPKHTVIRQSSLNTQIKEQAPFTIMLPII